jgi:antitoxin ParD1/3/4
MQSLEKDISNRRCQSLLSCWKGGALMNVSLTPQLEEMIHQKVETGLYNNASEVVREALRLLDERDRRLQWLRAEIAIGEEQMARGELITFTRERFEQIKREARESALSGEPVKDAVKP